MQLSLTPHPEAPALDLAIVAKVERHREGEIHLQFRVTGDIAGICLAAPKSPRRADNLWRTTCFEAFVGMPGTEAYLELNFAPSSQWAAYHFDTYRSGMRDADMLPPEIDVRQTADRFELLARLDLPLATPLRLGLAAVIEQSDGTKSYWALSHPPGAPDFHRRDCFALELPAATAS